MNLSQEKALLHLTGKPGLSQLQASSVRKIAEEYPYFAPAQFYLTLKTKEKDSPKVWLKNVQKTSLYFTNPYWLQFQFDAAALTEAMENDLSSHVETEIGMAIPTMEAFRELMRKIEPVHETTVETIKPVTAELEQENEETEDLSPVENKISGLLSSQLAEFRKPVEPDAVLDIDTEKLRMHTIDYFASQGIKVDLSAIPQDKLTTHLLKFTDWLKQLKQANLNPNDARSVNPEMEKAVAETAKNSNETREVVTEAMADILEKQGQTEKAIQLYIKLSFLNPEKSSYFAAKIEQLKGII
jgi:hypothetical protein